MLTEGPRSESSLPKRALTRAEGEKEANSLAYEYSVECSRSPRRELSAIGRRKVETGTFKPVWKSEEECFGIE